MEGQSNSETIRSPTSPSPSPSPGPASDHSRFSAPPPQSAECPPPPSDQSGEVDPSDNAAVNIGKKRTSWVWQEFELKENNGDRKAVCSHCKQHLSAKTSNGTKHLIDHLLRFCSKRHLRSSGQKTLRFISQSNGQKKLENHAFNQKQSRQELAEMIVMHEYPLSMVDHFGFKRFVSGLNPNFQMISRNTLRSDILTLFENEKSSLKKLLEVNQGRVAITTDMWTASNQKKGYMVVTAHFVDDDWVLCNRTLR